MNDLAANKLIKELAKRDPYELNDIIDSYRDGLKEPKPNTKQHWVGIELELFTRLNESELFLKFMEVGIDDYIDLVDDGSIEPDFGSGVEIRVCAPENKIAEVLKKMSKIIKGNKYGVNDSCGLHVHLDMRHRLFAQSYDKLLAFQDIMFGMVKNERWNNDYCRYSTKSSTGRYLAINKQSYSEHRTIEVRLHHATLNFKQIDNWVKLLLKCLVSPKIKEIKSKADVLKWLGKDSTLRKYVNNSFQETWFLAKKGVVNQVEQIALDPIEGPY